MPSWKQHFGTYLKSEDIPRPVRVVVDRVELADVKDDSGTLMRKLVAHFGGKEKGLILNQTNCEALQFAAGTGDYEQWAGMPMELYVDDNVKFGNKTVSGLRLRGVKSANLRQDPRPAPPPAEEFDSSQRPQQHYHDTRPTPPAITDDDIPF